MASSNISASEGRNIDFTGQDKRMSIKKGLEDYYQEGEGSIYTAFGYPSSGSLPKLQTQMDQGLSCFGYGRGVNKNVLGGQNAMIAGQDGPQAGRKGGARGRTGELIDGFVTRKVPMGASDYGSGTPENACEASWYRMGLSGNPSDFAYGNKFMEYADGSGGMARTRNTRSDGANQVDTGRS